MRTVRIAHISDSHLGYAGHDIQSYVEDPSNPGTKITQRAADIAQAFERTIDLILHGDRPDLVIHSGDLFDSARPAASTIDLAMRQISRLTREDIPILIVEGNHSYPRDRAMGHVLRLLEYISGVTVVCEEYAHTQLDRFDLLIHSLPHAALMAGAKPTIECINKKCWNVLVAHGVVDGMPFFKTGRPAPPVPLQSCDDWYHYIALGHYHQFCQPNLHPCAFYAGAPTMVTWGDFTAGHAFSFNLVTFADEEATFKRVTIPGRQLYGYGLDDARGLSAAEILTLVGRQRDALPPSGAYCLVEIRQVDPRARDELSRAEVEDLFLDAAALKVTLEASIPVWKATQNAQQAIGSPTERYVELVGMMDGDERFRNEVLGLGNELLEEAASALAAGDE